jgi:DNA polymerase-3 subunit gamma/tau
MDAPEAESDSWATAAPAESTASEPMSHAATPSAAEAARQSTAQEPSPPTTRQPTQQQSTQQAAPVARAGARPPAFEEKQRYGESVVREILGATFLEEQPHVSAPRSRGE